MHPSRRGRRSKVTRFFDKLSAATDPVPGRARRLKAGRYRGYRVLRFEAMERRVLLSSLPDLAGIDGRPYGAPDFSINQSTAYWGQAVQINFSVANYGGAASGGATYDIEFFLSPVSTIGGGKTSCSARRPGSPFRGLRRSVITRA